MNGKGNLLPAQITNNPSTRLRCKVKLAGEVAVRRVREGFEVSDPHRELVAEALSREGASRDGDRKSVV